jgi:hypothetical protein
MPVIQGEGSTPGSVSCVGGSTICLVRPAAEESPQSLKGCNTSTQEDAIF